METVLAKPRNVGDEAGLVERFRAGDEEAFERIVTEHRKSVYLMARRVLSSHEDADEAAQLAFVRAWRARASFRGQASLRTWLIRIGLNVAKTLKAGRGPQPAELSEQLPDGAERSDERVRRRELREVVRRAVRRLPQRQREVVLLKVFSELTYREVAGLLELSEGAVKAHLHQAVSNLRRLMGAARQKELG